MLNMNAPKSPNSHPDNHPASSLTYRDAGVDIEAGNRLVEAIKGVAKQTKRPEVLTGLGGFAALFELPVHRYEQPVLVSATDGVGTKLKLALALGKHDTLGIDLVAMCANDLVVVGAEPLFFLDYYATGKLDVAVAADVIKGIGDGCQQAGMSLIGGETAEMPGVYTGHDYDLAGFCVGVVEKQRIIDGKHVTPGDVLIGLASSGPHSNGYSLIRKIIEHAGANLDAPFADDDNKTLGECLLAPTKIYVKALHSLLQEMPVHAMAHITGGGLLENIPRVLPAHTQAVINATAWQRPAIFDWLQTQGNVANEEMFRTFNNGIGMVLCVAQENAKACCEHLNQLGEQAMPIGHIAPSSDATPQVIIQSS